MRRQPNSGSCRRLSQMRTYALSAPWCLRRVFIQEIYDRTNKRMLKTLALSMMNILINSFNTWCVDVGSHKNFYINRVHLKNDSSSFFPRNDVEKDRYQPDAYCDSLILFFIFYPIKNAPSAFDAFRPFLAL